MKAFILILILFLFYSCNHNSQNSAQSRVKLYLLTNLKNVQMRSYKQINFSKLDTLSKQETLENGKIASFTINHQYSVVNSDGHRIQMSVKFFLDSGFRVIETDSKNIDGEYSTLEGNIFYRKNDIDSSLSDAGATVTLYSLDSIRHGLKFETIADVRGNYKITNIPPGEYFYIINSKNSIQCADHHILNLDMYSEQIEKALDIDLDKYRTGINEVLTLDSLAFDILKSCTTEYRGSRKPESTFEKTLEVHKKSKLEVRKKANEVIKSLPKDVQNKIKLYGEGDKAQEFEVIKIDQKTIYKNVDLGVTCQ